MEKGTLNRRGMYTIIDVEPGVTKVLVIYTGEPEAKELAQTFENAGKAFKFMRENAKLLDKSDPKPFHMVWMTQRAMHGGKRH